MELFYAIISAVIPIILITSLGSFARKTNFLPEGSDTLLMKVSINLFMPCLIFTTLVKSDISQSSETVFISILTGFSIVICTTSLALLFAWIFKLKIGNGRRTFAFTTGIQNYGYFAIPIVGTLFPDDGAVAALFLHNVGIEMALWTFCLMLLRGSFKIKLKDLFNGPIIAVIAGLVVSFTGLFSYIPTPLFTTVEMLAACAFPVALLVIGATFYDLLGKVKFNVRLCLGACSLRLLLFPILFLSIVSFITLPLPLEQVLVVHAALPSAMSPIMLARHYGGQVSVAVQIVVTTTFACIITLPIILWFGLKLLDNS